jgi:hypothetical protein
VGTEQSAYEVVIDVEQVASGVEGQTSYRKVGVRVAYQYRQYTSCRNNLQSKSQHFSSLTIKICSYEPPDQLVFANFVSIANDTPRALIQFYNRSGLASYPFRTDTIYSNALSHHSFLIRQDTLIVASLFNLLCYYALAGSLRWQLRIDPYHPRIDRHCQGALVISNLQFRTELQVRVSYDDEEEEDDYWTNSVFYLQRGVLLLLLANCIRLLWKARSKRTTKLRKKFSARPHANRFEVMVKINSKISN